MQKGAGLCKGGDSKKGSGAKGRGYANEGTQKGSGAKGRGYVNEKSGRNEAVQRGRSYAKEEGLKGMGWCKRGRGYANWGTQRKVVVQRGQG